MTTEKLAALIEAVLQVANRPLSVAQLADAAGASKEDAAAALDALAARLQESSAGVCVVRQGSDVQLATAPDAAETVREFLKDETTGELTKPSLETLTIVAYRGPITKAELEQVRGVNCSLILRNLMMRGLVQAKGDPQNPAAMFSVTMDFVKHLGLSRIEDLPDYEKLRSHEDVTRVLAGGEEPRIQEPDDAAA